MRSPSALGLGLDVGAAPVAPAPPGGASNLLLWTEAMDNAVWSKNASVTPDASANPSPPGDGSSTADLCTFVAANRFILQSSGIPATSGSAVLNITPTGTWTRYVRDTVFDVGTYTVSVYVQGVSGLGTLRLVLDVAGGVIEAKITAIAAASVANIWGWQLETGGSATGYVPRTT